MHQLATLRAYLVAKIGAVETYPFGPSPLVLKVGGKMFALIGTDDTPLTISLKCDPYEAQFLREQVPAVTAGYHLDKRHWITVTLDGSLDDSAIARLIDQSYTLVVKGLPKAVRQELALNQASSTKHTNEH